MVSELEGINTARCRVSLSNSIVLLSIAFTIQHSSYHPLTSLCLRNSIPRTGFDSDVGRLRSVSQHGRTPLERNARLWISFAVIEDWGKEFVEYFVSICLRSLLRYDTDTSVT